MPVSEPTNRPRHYNTRKSQAGREHLFEVLTLREACALFHLSESALRYAIDTGKVAARQQGKGRPWMISKASLVEVYGHSPLIKSQKLRISG